MRSRGVQLRRALVALGALALAVAPAACSGGGGGTAGVEFTEVSVDVDEYDYVNGVVAWKDGFVAVTGEGVVLRSPDGEQWGTVDATGLDDDPDPDAEPIIRTDLAGITAGDDFLLAAGTRAVGTGDDDARFVPMIWRSEDGLAWEQLETSGLTARYLDAIAASDGTFLAFGTEDIPRPPGVEPEEELDEEEEDGTGEEDAGEPDTIPVSSTWRSEDGAQWERVGDNLIPPGENAYEDMAAVGAVGEQLLASIGSECSGCSDDYAFALSRSEDAGETWRALEETGLDDIRLANTDVIPRVVGFDDGFVAVGTSPDGDDTVATLWRSTDGADWTAKKRLGGPREYEYAESIDAIAATETGVVVLEIRGEKLAVWRVNLQ